MTPPVLVRSYEPLTRDDLDILADIARHDLENYFQRNRQHAPFRGYHLGSALCQGAALHYVDSSCGIKDFDVYHFFAKNPHWSFHPRREASADFGTSKFGCHPADIERGRCRGVDLMGRSIDAVSDTDSVASIRLWLRESGNRTPRELRKKAVVMLEPDKLRGVVVWPAQEDR